MKSFSGYHRKVRSRGNSREVVIPKPLYNELSLGKYQYLHVWINKKWNMEISNGELPFNKVNGIILNRQVTTHGGSYAMTIPHEVVDTLEAAMGNELDEVLIFKNKNSNIEFQFIKNSDKNSKRNGDRLKVSYNIGTYRYVRYLN